MMNKGGKLKIIIICFLLSCIGIVITTPIHEAAHWIMSEIDPYSDPVEFHVFDFKTIDNEQHILSSPLGSVIIRESYPGSFNDRPQWIDPVQEIICIFIQVLITCIIITKILELYLSKNKSIAQA